MMSIDLEALLPLICNAEIDLVTPLEEAQREVDSETDPEQRKVLFKKYQPRWTALRPYMARLSHGKCWYTESKNPGFDNDIDHYRPKGSVDVEKGEREHGGYYWLAFYWRNYRLSCRHSNRFRVHPETEETGGKGDRFPLLDPGRRLRTPTLRQMDLDDEQPLLLDPTRSGDEAVISFNAKGLTVISPVFEPNPVEVRRFEETKKCYHLDWPDFRSDRVELYNLILRKVNRGNEIAPPEGASSLTWPREFDIIVQELRRLMDPDRPYSRASRVYLMEHRSRWWVELHVLRIERLPLLPAPAPDGAAAPASPSTTRTTQG